ncbi:dienelactone hydrolase family protein [bacterium]|nr:dienelactone hydrolase family protein [candidate division CSSED10-310 bacterium]
MKLKKNGISVLMCVFGVVCGVGIPGGGIERISAADDSGYDWTRPETINIDDPAIVDHFDVNPSKILAEGWKAYQEKRYEVATRYYLAYVHQVRNDALNLYNLACCYGLLGRAETAAAWVTKAVEAGWKDLEHLRNDPDFQAVRDTEVFKTTVAALQAKLDREAFDPGRMMMLPSRGMIPVYIKLPADFDPDKTYPLVVGLHGYGDTAERFSLIWEERKLTGEFIYAAMEAPFAFQTGKDIGYSWFLRMDPVEHHDLMMTASDMTVSNVLAGIDRLKKEYRIDKVFLTGFSQGACLTFITGLKNPGLFAGIAPMGGWLDTDVVAENDLKAAKALPVLIVHGTQDSIVPYESGTKAEQVLKEHGFNVRMVSFDGGHTVSTDGLKALNQMMFPATHEGEENR